jgi:crotonobetainyl-CoA:carnitine CoA-transferase CaiB-like acyl-CoA transferase
MRRLKLDYGSLCERELNSHGVPCSTYRTVAEAMNDPQIAHRRALSEVGMAEAHSTS